MCTYHTERVEVAGSGKGPDGWFPLRLACVYFDHPQHTPAEHTLNIDFLNPQQGPAARVAVEAGARRLALTHISSRYNRDAAELLAEAKAVFPETIIARDGMTLDVPYSDGD